MRVMGLASLAKLAWPDSQCEGAFVACQTQHVANCILVFKPNVQCRRSKAKSLSQAETYVANAVVGEM